MVNLQKKKDVMVNVMRMILIKEIMIKRIDVD